MFSGDDGGGEGAFAGGVLVGGVLVIEAVGVGGVERRMREMTRPVKREMR